MSTNQQCIYSASGDFSCPQEKKSVFESFFQPAYVDSAAKRSAQSERSAGGYPYASTEWESKGNESKAWVGAEGFKAHSKSSSVKY